MHITVCILTKMNEVALVQIGKRMGKGRTEKEEAKLGKEDKKHVGCQGNFLSEVSNWPLGPTEFPLPTTSETP